MRIRNSNNQVTLKAIFKIFFKRILFSNTLNDKHCIKIILQNLLPNDFHFLSHLMVMGLNELYKFMRDFGKASLGFNFPYLL